MYSMRGTTEISTRHRPVFQVQERGVTRCKSPVQITDKIPVALRAAYSELVIRDHTHHYIGL